MPRMRRHKSTIVFAYFILLQNGECACRACANGSSLFTLLNDGHILPTQHWRLHSAHVPALFSRLHCRRCFHSVATSLRFSNNKPARTTAFCRYYYSAQTKFSRKNNTIQNKLIEYDIDVRVKNVLACGQK